MKILYIISNRDLDLNQNTGYARHILETISGFEALGHEVHLFSFSESDSGIQSIRSNSKFWTSLRKYIPSICLETIKDVWLFHVNQLKIKDLKEFIESIQPDVVYEREGYLVNVGALIDQLNIPWYIEVNAPLIEERRVLVGPSIFSSIGQSFIHKAYKNCSGVFCVSKDLKGYLKTKFSIDPKKINVNPNGVDLCNFELKECRDQVSEVYDFGFVGSILPFHGINVLIDAFAKIKDCCPNSRLLIVGDGAELPRFKAYAHQLGLESRIVFNGPVNHAKIQSKISQISICIMPKSNWYGSPVKIFEYGAMKKPVIAPNLGPVREIITHEYDGILVSNVTELASSMKRLYNDAELCRILGERLYQRVSANFTWRMNTQRIIDTIAEDL
jgi:glycosyltransferase involved in cell wall biosynthesis